MPRLLDSSCPPRRPASFPWRRCDPPLRSSVAQASSWSATCDDHRCPELPEEITTGLGQRSTLLRSTVVRNAATETSPALVARPSAKNRSRLPERYLRPPPPFPTHVAGTHENVIVVRCGQTSVCGQLPRQGLPLRDPYGFFTCRGEYSTVEREIHQRC